MRDVPGRQQESAPHAGRARRLWWRMLYAVGPGLVAMFADTDAASVITVAQSGAQWGYRLLLPNLLFIPFMFIAQELPLRLGLGTGKGCTELVLQRLGRGPAVLLAITLAASCFGALVSELSGLAGVGAAYGIPPWLTMFASVVVLGAVVGSGSYRSVESIALLVGLFELAFVGMAALAGPDLGLVAAEATRQPLHDKGYLLLLAANLGTSIIPWALLYQQSASVDKGLGPADIRAARLETLAGVVICQLITSALLIAAGTKLGRGVPLETVGEIATAFTATLGTFAGEIVFILGLSGSALVAAIVVCLTLAWSIGEAMAVAHSLERHPAEAPLFYGTLALMLIAGGVLVGAGLNLVDLAVGAGVANVLLLPVVFGFLWQLARTAPAQDLRLHGAYGAIVGLALLLASGVGLYAAIIGMF